MTGRAGCCSGISAVGDLPWGSHFCHLYETREDLLDTLVPLFAAGLANNEQCLWVTAQPLSPEGARRALASRIPDLQSRMDRGQIRIVDHSEWRTRVKRFDADSLLQAWIAGEQSAREAGYAGLRATVNVTFLKTREEWQEFERYESRVTETFAGRRLIGLCSYDLGRSQATDGLEVIRNHQFAVVRREGEWEVFENRAVALAAHELQKPDAELEQRVRERTAELQDALSELQEQHSHLEQVLRERETVSRAKDEFLAMLGHELRNPLAPMMTALQLMRLRGLHSREQEILARQVAHLTRLVDDLLDVSRIARGRIDLHCKPVEFCEIVIRSIEVVSPLIEQRQQILDVRVPSGGLLVNADLERMAQVIGNLLTNASKYSDPRSRILVTARRDGSVVRCTVKDEGIGIPPEMLDTVFESFVQQPQTLDRSRGGLGLGLTIVRNLVLQHGGSVHAESAGPGCGSEFIVELPELSG